MKKIASLPEGVYEKLEGLEQLRWIENHIKVKCVKVDYRHFAAAGLQPEPGWPVDWHICRERMEKNIQK